MRNPFRRPETGHDPHPAERAATESVPTPCRVCGRPDAQATRWDSNVLRGLPQDVCLDCWRGPDAAARIAATVSLDELYAALRGPRDHRSLSAVITLGRIGDATAALPLAEYVLVAGRNVAAVPTSYHVKVAGSALAAVGGTVGAVARLVDALRDDDHWWTTTTANYWNSGDTPGETLTWQVVRRRREDVIERVLRRVGGNAAVGAAYLRVLREAVPERQVQAAQALERILVDGAVDDSGEAAPEPAFAPAAREAVVGPLVAVYQEVALPAEARAAVVRALRLWQHRHDSRAAVRRAARDESEVVRAAATAPTGMEQASEVWRQRPFDEAKRRGGLFEFADLLIGRRDVAGARCVYETLMRTGRPNEAARATVDLGRLTERLGDGERARELYGRAVADGHPEVREAAARALRDCEQDAAEDPAQRPSTRATYDLARTAQQERRFADARLLFGRAVDAADPDLSPRAMLELATMLRDLREREAARGLFVRAVETGHQETPVAARPGASGATAAARGGRASRSR